MTRSESLDNWLLEADAGIEPNKSALNRWLEAMDGNPDNTWRIYVIGLRLFCRRWSLTPQRLFEMRVGELESDNYLEKGRIKSMARRLMYEMQKGDRGEWPEGARRLVRPGRKSHSTCRMVSKALTSFFSVFDDRLAIKFNRHETPSGSHAGSDNISKEQIKASLIHCGDEFPLRNIAIALFLKDSGLRESDVGELTIKDYRQARRRAKLNRMGEPFIAIDPKRTVKENIHAWIHLGPESIEAIDKYLRANRRSSKDDEPLFTMRQPKQYGGEDADPSIAISGAAVGGMVKRMIERALGSQVKKLTGHSFRKRHRTSLQDAGVNDKWIDILQGKAVGTYTRPSPEKLMDTYMRSYDYLRIYSSGTPLEENYKAQKKEIEDLKTQLETSQSELSAANLAIMTLRKNIDPMIEAKVNKFRKEILKELRELEKLKI